MAESDTSHAHSTAVSEPEQQAKTLHAELSDLQATLGQLLAILRRETTRPLPPPKHLQTRVVGSYNPRFIESGYTICDDMRSVLQVVARDLHDFGRVLDFGCGCGRIVRAFKTLAPSCDLHGTDIDGDAISWLQEHYPSIARFSVAPHLPPISYDDDTFDFIYGISVFTHLPEDMAQAWLEELRRITRPGGYVLLTTHGEKHYEQLDSKVRDILNTKGFFYSDFGQNYGRSISLPDFYQTSFHSHKYIRREWVKYFDVVDIQALRCENHQDTILLSKRR